VVCSTKVVRRIPTKSNNTCRVCVLLCFQKPIFVRNHYGSGDSSRRICVCCFVLLNQYWGSCYGPGPGLLASELAKWTRTHDLETLAYILTLSSFQQSGGQMLTLHLNYIAGYTGPLLFHFERTHNYPVDDQGLLPCWLCCLGESKIRSASLVRDLSGGKISR